MWRAVPLTATQHHVTAFRSRTTYPVVRRHYSSTRRTTGTCTGGIPWGEGKNNRQKEFFPTRKTSGCASYVCHETAPLLAPIPIQADRPTTLSATSNLYSPRSRYCVAHECRDRRRDRNILLSKRFPGGSLKGGRSPCAARSTQLQGVIGKQVGGSGVLCPQGPQRRSRATTWDISAKRSLPKSRRRGAFSEVSAEIVPSWI